MTRSTDADAETVRVVSINEACALVGVSRRTIYHWISKGYLDIVWTAGGRQRIVEASLWRSTSPLATRTNGTACEAA